MKTRASPDSPLSVNLVSPEPLLAERLKRYSRKNPELEIRVSSSPLAGMELDAFVLPAEALPAAGELEALKATGAALIAYGPPELLRACFLAGCDDFLKNPWSPEELECRLRRAIGPRISATGLELAFPWGRLALRGFSLQSDRASLALSYPESRIFTVLARNRGKAVSREALAYAVWGRPPGKGSRAVDVHVSSLRRKLLRLARRSRGCIRGLRGVGYTLE